MTGGNWKVYVFCSFSPVRVSKNQMFTLSSTEGWKLIRYLLQETAMLYFNTS